MVYERVRLIDAVDCNQYARFKKFVQDRVIIRWYFGQARYILILLFTNGRLSVVGTSAVIRRRLSDEGSGRVTVSVHDAFSFVICFRRTICRNLSFLLQRVRYLISNVKGRYMVLRIAIRKNAVWRFKLGYRPPTF